MMKLYKCRRCKETFGEDEIPILYVSGKPIRRCPNCGGWGTLKRLKQKL